MHSPRTLRVVATLAITVLGLSTAGVAHARWPARPDRQLTLTTLENDAALVTACPDGTGGAYVLWTNSSWPDFASRLEHLDAFGDDLFASRVVIVDSLVGYPRSIVSDDAGGVMLLGSRQLPAGDLAHVLSRVSARGEILWCRTVASTAASQGNGDAVCLARSPGSTKTMVVWADDREITRQFRAQAIDASGQSLWSDSGAVVATCSPWALLLLQPQAPDGRGGLWVAVLDYGPSRPSVIRYQHLGADGSAQWPDTARALEMNTGLAITTDLVPDGAGGFWIGSNPSPATWLQRIRSDGSPAFGPDGATVPGPLAPYPALPSLGGLVSGRLMVAGWQEPTWTLRVQVIDSTGVWMWPGDGVPAASNFGQSQVDVYANADGGATVTLRNTCQVYDALCGAQRFDADGLMLWSDPAPVAMVADAWQLEDASPIRSVPTGDGGVIFLAAFADSGDWGGANCIRAQHLDAHGRLGDTSPRIVSVRDVPGDLGGALVVRWKASCLEGDSTMATVAYDVLRQQPDGSGCTTLAVVGTLAAVGDSEYVAQVPTLADSTSPGAAPTVLRVRARDAAGREWTSPPAAGASYANGPLGVGPSAPALSLAAPSPSPASSRTQVRYTLAAAGRVSLDLLDVAGRRVRTVASGAKPAGPHSEALELRDDAGRRLPAGLYFVRLTAAGHRLTRRLVVLP